MICGYCLAVVVTVRIGNFGRFHFHLRGIVVVVVVLWVVVVVVVVHLEGGPARSHLGTKGDYQRIFQSRMTCRLKNSWGCGCGGGTRRRILIMRIHQSLFGMSWRMTGCSFLDLGNLDLELGVGSQLEEEQMVIEEKVQVVLI